MNVRYYLDRNPPRAVKLGLLRRGIDVIDTDDDGTATLRDEALLMRASALGRVIFTHDEDFLAISARWHAEGREHGGIVYVHMHRLSIGDMVRELERLATRATAEQLANSVVYLPWSPPS